MYKDLVLATTTDELLEAAEAEILDVRVLLDAVPAALTAQPTLLNGNILTINNLVFSAQFAKLFKTL
jgi:phosphatidylserine/phosphatidylglycerophosphate/cardiolipin synthase-like enzyme